LRNTALDQFIGYHGTLGRHLQYSGVPKCQYVFQYIIKIRFQNVIKPWSNCYGFATRHSKLHFSSAGCHKPQKGRNHCSSETITTRTLYSDWPRKLRQPIDKVTRHV